MAEQVSRSNRGGARLAISLHSVRHERARQVVFGDRSARRAFYYGVQRCSDACCHSLSRQSYWNAFRWPALGLVRAGCWPAFPGCAMASHSKQELVDFVIRKALDPVLKAKPDGRSEADKKKLERVQDATRSEVERYRKYGSAEEVVTNFKRDLHSSAAKKVHAELQQLGLPTINDIRDEFEAKARDLGVNG
jgi:hypothetical protein